MRSSTETALDPFPARSGKLGARRVGLRGGERQWMKPPVFGWEGLGRGMEKGLGVPLLDRRALPRLEGDFGRAWSRDGPLGLT